MTLSQQEGWEAELGFDHDVSIPSWRYIELQSNSQLLKDKASCSQKQGPGCCCGTERISVRNGCRGGCGGSSASQPLNRRKEPGMKEGGGRQERRRVRTGETLGFFHRRSDSLFLTTADLMLKLGLLESRTILRFSGGEDQRWENWNEGTELDPINSPVQPSLPWLQAQLAWQLGVG